MGDAAAEGSGAASLEAAPVENGDGNAINGDGGEEGAVAGGDFRGNGEGEEREKAKLAEAVVEAAGGGR